MKNLLPNIFVTIQKESTQYIYSQHLQEKSIIQKIDIFGEQIYII